MADEPNPPEVHVPEAPGNWQVWDVCVGFDVVGTIERADDHGYVAACWDSDQPGDRYGLSRAKCWDGPEPYESVQGAVHALSQHRYAVHVRPDEQHLDQVLSLTPQTGEARALRDQLRRAMGEGLGSDQP